MPTTDMYAFVYVRRFQAWLPPYLLMGVASVALSFLMHHSDTCTCIRAKPLNTLDMPRPRATHASLRSFAPQPVFKALAARIREPGRLSA